MRSQNTSNSSYDVYDEVLDYLLSEGFSLEESNQIMVELINEGGLGSLLKGAAKFVQRRASTPIKTAVTDLATTAIATGGAPAGKVGTAAVRTASPTPIVRTFKGSVMRTPPRAPSPDPWKQSSNAGSRIKDILKTPTPKPSSQKALSGAPSPKALSGSPSRPSLPSSSTSSRGGAIVPSSPAGKLVKQTQRSTDIVKTSPVGKLAKQTQKSADIVKASPTGKLAKQSQRSSAVASSSRKVTSPADARVEPVSVRVVSPETQSTRSFSGVENPTKSLPSGKTPKAPKKKIINPPSGSSGSSATKSNLGKRLKNILKAGAVAGTAASALSPTSTSDETRSSAERKGLIAPPAPKLPAPETTKTKQKAPSAPKLPAPETSVTSKLPKVATQKPKTSGDSGELKWPPLTPPPPVDKKPSISKDIEDIRGAVQRSKMRQKEMTNK